MSGTSIIGQIFRSLQKTRITTAHILKFFFFNCIYLAVLIFNFLKIGLQKLKIWSKMQFLYFRPILSAIFVTIATVKFKYMPKFYTSVILPINRSKEIGEKQFSVLGSKGGQISPLMHVPLWSQKYPQKP